MRNAPGKEILGLANSVIDSCESTNDLAKQLGELGAEHGTWISARVQTRGRGRLGRNWQSQAGNLFLSMVVRMEASSSPYLSWVPLSAAVAVRLAIQQRLPGLDIRVKWPNDLWLSGAKLGGILCEAVGKSSGSFIVIGLGLNCLSAPEHLDQPTACLGVAADSIRPLVVRELRDIILQLNKEGPRRVSEAYYSCAALPAGTQITWGQAGEQGRVVGLGPSSELFVELPDGSRIPLYAEDVRIRPLTVAPKASGGSPA